MSHDRQAYRYATQTPAVLMVTEAALPENRSRATFDINIYVAFKSLHGQITSIIFVLVQMHRWLQLCIFRALYTILSLPKYSCIVKFLNTVNILTRLF